MHLDRLAGLPNPPPIRRSKLPARARCRLPSRRRFFSASSASRPIQPLLRAWMESMRNRPPDRLEGNGHHVVPATTPAVTDHQSHRNHPSDEQLFAARVTALINERHRLLRRALIHRLQHLREAILLSESGHSAELTEALSSTSFASPALSVVLHDRRNVSFVPPLYSPRRISPSPTGAAHTSTAVLAASSRAELAEDTNAPATSQAQLSVDTNVLATSHAQLPADATAPPISQAQFSADTNELVNRPVQPSADASVLAPRQAQLSADTNAIAARQSQLSASADLPVTNQTQPRAAATVPSTSETQLSVDRKVPAIRSILVGSPLRDANRPKQARRVSFAIDADTPRRGTRRSLPPAGNATDLASACHDANQTRRMSRAFFAFGVATDGGPAVEGSLPSPARTSSIGSADLVHEEQPHELVRDDQMHFGDRISQSPQPTEYSRDMPLDMSSMPDHERGQVQHSPLLVPVAADNSEFHSGMRIDSASQSHQPHESKYIPSTTLAERVDSSGSTRVQSCSNQPQTESGGVSQSLSRSESGLTTAQDHNVSGQSVSGILPCELHLFSNYLSESAVPLTIDRFPVPLVPQNSQDNVALQTRLVLQRTANQLTKLLHSEVQRSKEYVSPEPPTFKSSGSPHQPVQQAAQDSSDSQAILQPRQQASGVHRSASPNGSSSILDEEDGVARLGSQFFDQELHGLFDEKFRLTEASREQSMIKATGLCKQSHSLKRERRSPTSLIKDLDARIQSLFSFSETDAHVLSSKSITDRPEEDQRPSIRSKSEPHPIFPSSLSCSKIGVQSPYLRGIPPEHRNITKSSLTLRRKNGIHERDAVKQCSSSKSFQRRTYLNMSEHDERRSATAEWQVDVTCYAPLSSELIQASAQQPPSHVAYAFASNTRGNSTHHAGQGAYSRPDNTTTALNFGFQRRTNYPLRAMHHKQLLPVAPTEDKPPSSAAFAVPSSRSVRNGLKPYDILRFADQSITDYGNYGKEETENVYSIDNDGKLQRQQ